MESRNVLIKSKVPLSVTATLLLDSVKSLHENPKASPVIFLTKMQDGQIPDACGWGARGPKAIV